MIELFKFKAKNIGIGIGIATARLFNEEIEQFYRKKHDILCFSWHYMVRVFAKMSSMFIGHNAQLFLFTILIVLSSCGDRKYIAIEDERIQMGTLWRVKVYSLDTIHARQTIEEAWALLDSLNNLLSNYEPDSEVSRLSKLSGTDKWLSIHPYTVEILEYSRSMWEATQGAFDITIGPLTKQWRRAFEKQDWPAELKLKEAQTHVGLQFLEVEEKEKRARLTAPDMSIDLGGIGKGYAIDKMAALLEEAGLQRYMIDGGGDIRVGATPPGQKGWHIVRETVDSVGQLTYTTDTLEHIAIATSGNAYQSIVQDGQKYQHHIHPATGRAQTDIYQVTVMNKECWKADALSTSISILGSTDIKGFQYKGFLITERGGYSQSDFSNL